MVESFLTSHDDRELMLTQHELVAEVVKNSIVHVTLLDADGKAAHVWKQVWVASEFQFKRTLLVLSVWSRKSVDISVLVADNPYKCYYWYLPNCVFVNSIAICYTIDYGPIKPLLRTSSKHYVSFMSCILQLPTCTLWLPSVLLQEDIGKTIVIQQHSNFLIQQLVNASTVSCVSVRYAEPVKASASSWSLYDFSAGTWWLQEPQCRQIIQVKHSLDHRLQIGCS